MLDLTFTMISNVGIARYRISHANNSGYLVIVVQGLVIFLVSPTLFASLRHTYDSLSSRPFE